MRSLAGIVDTLCFPFLEVKAADDGEPGTFTGYGSTFGNVDLGKDRVIKGAFKDAIATYLKAKQMPAMFWQHDARMPIGDWHEVEEDDKGLRVKGRLWIGKGIPEAERAYCMLRGTGPKGLSIGYVPKLHDKDDKGVRNLKAVDLPEISVVGYGMNPKATVSGIKAADSHLDLDAILAKVRGPMRDFVLEAKMRSMFKPGR